MLITECRLIMLYDITNFSFLDCVKTTENVVCGCYINFKFVLIADEN